MPSPCYDSIDSFRDIESINSYAELRASMTEAEALQKINFGSRDNSRRPMAWDGGEKGGFTTGAPWIPLHSRQKEINLENDLASERSVFRFCQRLLKLRAGNDAFLDGTFQVVSREEDDFFAFTRMWESEKWAVICNFDREQRITLPFVCEVPHLSNLGRTQADGVYQPYECAVCRVRH